MVAVTSLSRFAACNTAYNSECTCTLLRFVFSLSPDPRMRNSVWMNSVFLGWYYLSTMTMQPQMMRYSAVQTQTKAKL